MGDFSSVLFFYVTLRENSWEGTLGGGGGGGLLYPPNESQLEPVIGNNYSRQSCSL